MGNAVDGGDRTGGKGLAHVAVGFGFSVGSQILVVDGAVLLPTRGPGLGIQGHHELPVAAVEIQIQETLMQDRRRTRATEVVALQVAPFPQLFARARVQTSRARLAKRYVNPALFDDRGGGCVAVVPFPEIRLIGLENQQVVDHFARVSVEAHRVESTAAVVGRGHPNLVSPNHRGGPPFVMDCGLPSDVLLLGPLQRKLRRGADTIATRTSEFGPIFVGG